MVAVSLGAACDAQVESLLCESAGCGWSDTQWSTLASLAAPSDWRPAADRSNRYVGNTAAERLGHRLFFDTGWSGPSTQLDVLRRPVGYARADAGRPTNLSCASCHNLSRAGADTESLPGNVSIGAAWADTNALGIFNSAFYELQFWNGRSDSQWAQAVAVIEGTNMNGNRLATAWLLHEKYKAEYDAVFTEHPLPLTASKAAVQALVETEGARAGQCRMSPDCPTTAGCREVSDPDSGATGCFPRFPLAGKPGLKPQCQPGDPAEPHGDAFDCMAEEDREAITRVLVNYGKAVAAYEALLVSKESPFDRYVRSIQEDTPRPPEFSVAAERGARLFVGKAACVDCHNTPLFSDNRFHNAGVDQVGPGVPTEADCPAGGLCDCVTDFADHQGANCLPWGAADGLWKLTRNQFRRDSRWSDDPSDTSREHWRKMDMKRVARGSWRTPTLRDVALTPPYMHNGSLATLEAVIEHYDRGGSSNAAGARSAQIKPLFLSPSEKADLTEFLKSLTGAPPPAEFLNKPELP